MRALRNPVWKQSVSLISKASSPVCCVNKNRKLLTLYSSSCLQQQQQFENQKIDENVRNNITPEVVSLNKQYVSQEPALQHEGNQELLVEDVREYYVRPSIFPETRPGSVLFKPYEPHEEFNKDSAAIVHVPLEPEDIPNKAMYFKMPPGATEYNAIRVSFLRAGFKRVRDDSWNVWWGRHLSAGEYQKLNAFQKMNHFPGSINLGRKDSLGYCLHRMQQEFGEEEYGFFPETYTLPEQHDEYMREIVDGKAKKDDGYLMIRKPPASSCGRGIAVYKPSEWDAQGSFVVQRYIDNPLLINGLKFDLRLYVVVTSFNPLRVYLYDDGLTRFATQQYDNENISGNRYAHLTNYSVNKFSETFVRNQDDTEDNTGSKWSVKALRRYFAENGLDDTKIWKGIEDIIIKSLISVESRVVGKMSQIMPDKRASCFELYGFDVMIDSDLKPWLIEVNLMPSMSSSSPLDRRIKYRLLNETFNLVGVTPYDRANMDAELEKLEAPQNLRTVEDLSNVDLGQLTDYDKFVIQEAEDELCRTGSFERIFPTAQSATHLRFFSEERYDNHLLSAWENIKNKFLQTGKNTITDLYEKLRFHRK